MKRFVLALLILSFAPGAAYSQAPKVDSLTDEQLQQSMEEAKRRTELLNKQIGGFNRPTQSSPRIGKNLILNTEQVDPLTIAKSFQEKGIPGQPVRGDQLYIFISLSMPEEALKRLSVQAKKYDAVLVLRGVDGGLGKGSLQKMLAQLNPIIKAGGAFQIHPQLFDRFTIESVPAFVLSVPPPADCKVDCVDLYAAAAGDVSLDFALEHFQKRTDDLGIRAADRLNHRIRLD